MRTYKKITHERLNIPIQKFKLRCKRVFTVNFEAVDRSRGRRCIIAKGLIHILDRSSQKLAQMLSDHCLAFYP